MLQGDDKGQIVDVVAQHIWNLRTPATSFFFNTLYDPYCAGLNLVDRDAPTQAPGFRNEEFPVIKVRSTAEIAVIEIAKIVKEQLGPSDGVFACAADAIKAMLIRRGTIETKPHPNTKYIFDKDKMMDVLCQQGVHGVPEDFVYEQLKSVLSDMHVDVVKTGMLPSIGVVKLLCHWSSRFKEVTYKNVHIEVNKAADHLGRLGVHNGDGFVAYGPYLG
ncbi:hypothetical protein IFM89_010753 [Coptis chinensis]|uniref:Pyridoxamine kinase/Phosphomethylpyrimidine kinase domain-containing protein n=1 Tax=Coptis chinensis TaxID=261450 RepID=A0A835INZ0_9MAGN|nr:hypothetical protein IFM89_010753 [Coptis chinensis]